MEVRGQTVVLRPLALADIARLVEIGRQPEVSRWWTSITEEKLTEKAEGRDDATPLAILSGGEVVGMIQYHRGGASRVPERRDRQAGRDHARVLARP